MFTVEMLPAEQGDALWIEYGDPHSPNRILIDGGLVGTVEQIKEKVHAVAAQAGGRCRLELLVLSHIDGDHIEGLIKLLGSKDLPLEIDDLWFNGWHHLPADDVETEDEFLGARQGEFLAALIRERDIPWNKAFKFDSIFVPRPDRGKLPRKELPGGMKIVLLSPTFKGLLNLGHKWKDELKTAGLLYATHEELMEKLGQDKELAPEDDFLSIDPIVMPDLLAVDPGRDSSAANASSIAFIGEYGGRRCLFAGDAHRTVLRDSLTRLAQEEGEERIELDAFKLPHHGSNNNISDKLLGLLDCRRFLVSTNGRGYQHPDREAIARLLGGAWRPAPKDSDKVELVFNYRSDFTLPWDDGELIKDWNYKPVLPSVGDVGYKVKL